MNRLVLGLIVVATAAGILAYLVSDHGHRAAPAPAPAPAAATATGSATIVRDHTKMPPPVLPAPDLPASSGSDTADSYTIGGVQVRDHRGGGSPHMDIPPNIHPPEAHEISSAIVQNVAQQVRGVMKQCAQGLPGDERGTKPRVEGQLVVAIKDHQLTVTGATMQLRDVQGGALESTRQCIEQGSVGLHAAAADEPDVDHYSISVNFALL